MDKLDKVWERIRNGRHTGVLGDLPADLPPSCGFYAVRVSCDGTLPALGPLRQARAQVEELLGGPPPILDQAAERVWVGLRRRLLGEVPEVLPGGAIVESLNRLRTAEGTWALVFEDVESADEDTLHLLREMITRPRWLRVPLLITFGQHEPQGAAGALLTALTAVEGSDGLVQIEPPGDSHTSLREPPPQSLRDLPSEVLTVLRAGALIGSGFEAELVAALLGLSPLRVLELLQVAADAGVPLEDEGEGRFDLPVDLAQGLRASTLPSLAIAWHRQLADLLSQSVTAPAADEARAPESAQNEDGTARPPSSRSNSGQTESVAPSSEPLEMPTSPPPPSSISEVPLKWPYADLFHDRPATPVAPPAPTTPQSGSSSGSSSPPSNPPGTLPEGTPSNQSGSDYSRPYSVATDPSRSRPDAVPAASRRERSEPRTVAQDSQREARDSRDSRPRDTDRTPPRSIPPVGEDSGSVPGSVASDLSSRVRVADSGFRKNDGVNAGNEARAATHFVAAGDIENGAARFLTAAREAAAVGAFVQAVNYAREALGLIEGLPAAPRRRRLRILALCELGRLQWQAVGPGGKFTLASAIESLDAAQHLLEDDDPIELRAEVSTLLASIYYDIGDLHSLERALDELTRASRALLATGDALGAARLLNDQAAVYVRLGDPVRASHLLTESRRVFERLASADPMAAAELAETDHLFARLPLHVAARPGRETDAIEMGMSHARAAESAYRQLGATRELTRVWETIGRLELRANRLDRALRCLSTALEAQRELGDVLGLARTTAALAEVLARGAQYDQALSLLGESIALNLEKGSPIGLAFNRRSLETLSRALPPGQAGYIALAQEVGRKLASAEGVLGRLKLPGELD